VSHVRGCLPSTGAAPGRRTLHALSAEAIRGAAALGAQVLVLPELMQSGYVFNDVQEAYALSEPLDGPTLTLWKTLASQLNLIVVAGFLRRLADARWPTARR
jgi:predicted amidohydrolase